MMTRTEAIECLTAIIDAYEMFVDMQINSDVPIDDEDIQALKMAISALSENKGNLISRQAVKDIILGGVSTDTDVDKEYVCGLIDNLPSAENKGEWVHILDLYYEDGTERESHWECSKCGSGRSGWGEFKFCPDCGADMRGKI